jgi:hypothetical protein
MTQQQTESGTMKMRLRRLRRRTRARGVIFTEYLIVTAFVFLVLMSGFYTLGPKVMDAHREAVKIVVEKSP